MKPRRVLLTLECNTAEPLVVFREGVYTINDRHLVVMQVQANVIRATKPKAREKRKR